MKSFHIKSLLCYSFVCQQFVYTSYARDELALSLLSSVPGGGGILTCPERFPAVQVVEAEEGGSKSCGAESAGQGCEQEWKLAIWPGIRWRLQEAECLFLPEVVVEPVWLDWVAQAKRAEEAAAAAAQESCLKRKLELQ